jgi:prepilin-type N-terminal cleavage/methylation domain-containing protein
MRRIARRLRGSEDGFTLIELLVAASVMAVGLIALVTTFDHSRDLVSLSERTEAATHQAEREIERILALPYSSVALKTTPASSADQSNPARYVVSGSPARYQWDQGATGPQVEDLVVDAAGSLVAGPIAWQDSQSRLEGTVHRFVTWTGDMCASCAGVQRAKRVTVAVTVDGTQGPRRPVLISTIKIDPTSVGTG